MHVFLVLMCKSYPRILQIHYKTVCLQTAEQPSTTSCTLIDYVMFYRETCTVDVSSLYRQLLESYHSSESDDAEQDGSKSHYRIKAAAARSMRASLREASRQSGPFDWKRACRELLEMLWACRDSEPFR